jgi:acid phosphatase (class A)
MTGFGATPLDGPLDDPETPFAMLTTPAGEAGPAAADPDAGAGFPDRWWSPALRAQLILAEVARGDWHRHDPGPPRYDSPAVLAEEIKALLDRRMQRAVRLPEIMAQSDDFTDYLLQLLTADGGRRPYTATLVQAGMQVGSMVVLHWKAKYRRARPSQHYPALLPMIPVPPHPSYPSGHALQAHLVRHMVADIFEDAGTRAAMDAVLEKTANRIAGNREIAGVHFPSDSCASRALAPRLMPGIRASGTYRAVLGQARREWAGIAAGPVPGNLLPWETFADDVAQAVTDRLARRRMVAR